MLCWIISTGRLIHVWCISENESQHGGVELSQLANVFLMVFGQQ